MDSNPTLKKRESTTSNMVLAKMDYFVGCFYSLRPSQQYFIHVGILHISMELHINPLRATYNLQQTTISKFTAFSYNLTANKAGYFMTIVCQQTILMKYHTLIIWKIMKNMANLLSAAVMIGTLRVNFTMQANMSPDLIWVHIICNIGYQITQADERADDNCHECQEKVKKGVKIRAVTCDFQQCGILTRVDSDKPLKTPLKLRNTKRCSVSSLTIIEYTPSN